MSPERRPWAEPDAPSPTQPPAFTVLRGEPTDEELAALTAVLAAATSAAQETPEARPATRNETLRRASRLRNRIMAVPGAWRMRSR